MVKMISAYDRPDRNNDVVEDFFKGDITLKIAGAVHTQFFEVGASSFETGFDFSLRFCTIERAFCCVSDAVGCFGLDGKLFAAVRVVIFAKQIFSLLADIFEENGHSLYLL